MNKAIWEKSPIQVNQNFSKNIDTLIIGGGLSGLLTAYFLMGSEHSVMVVDKGKIGSGVSIKSTAKITYLQKNIYSSIAKIYNQNIANKYYNSQKEGIKILKDIINLHKINCDFSPSKSYLFANTKKGLKSLNTETKLLKSFGAKLNKEQLPIEFPNKKAISVDDTYVFNPCMFMQGLVNTIENYVKISENTLVYNIKKRKNNYVIFTNKGIILAKKVVLACHYPFFLVPYFFPIKMHVEREYVNYGEYPKNYNFNAISLDDELASIRFYKNNLIYVSNSHRINSNLPYTTSFYQSKKDFKKNFNVDVTGTWINQDIFTHDNLPIVGKIEKNLYVITGFNGWGMTNSAIAARVISNNIKNVKDEYENLLSLKRAKILTIKNIIVEGYFNAKSYLVPLFLKQKIFKRKINGITYNVYRDKDNKLHYARSKCPHMKCNLIFNKNDLTWDCPCHGSRFNIDGELILGPAKNNINKNEKY